VTPAEDPIDPLVCSVAASVSAAGRPAALIDVDFGYATEPKIVPHDPNLWVVRPDTLSQVMPLIEELLRAGVDMLAIRSLLSAVTNPKAGHGIATELRDVIGAIDNVARIEGRSVLLVERDSPLNPIDDYYRSARTAVVNSSALELVRPTSSSESGMTAYEVISPRNPLVHNRVSIEIEPDGTISRTGDLLDAGAAQNLIRRDGPRYFYANELLGADRHSAKVSLTQRPNLAQRLEFELNKQLEEQLDSGAKPLIIAPPSRRHSTDQTSRTTPIDRVVNTWFESEHRPVLPLLVGSTYVFKLDIGAPHHERGAQGATFTEPDFGDRKNIDLLISLFSDDFTIASPHHRLNLPKKANSDVIRANVTVLRPGRCRIDVIISLRRELEVLQRLQVEVEAIRPSVQVER